MANPIARIRSRQIAEKLDQELRASPDPVHLLQNMASGELHRLVSYHVLFRRRTKAEAIEALIPLYTKGRTDAQAAQLPR